MSTRSTPCRPPVASGPSRASVRPGASRAAGLAATLLVTSALAACSDEGGSDAPSASGGSGQGGAVAGQSGGAGAAGQASAGQGGAGQAGAGQGGAGAGGNAGNAGAGQGGGGQGGAAGTAGGSPGPLDEVIAAMPPNSWKELPGTDMAQVCPPGNHYHCDAIMTAWSGGALDTVRDRLVVFGGGHGDSPYNNVFTFDLHEGTWKRWTELPAGMTGDSIPAVYQDKRIESCGLYPSVDALTIPDEWLTPTGYLDPGRCDDPTIVPQLDPQQPRSAHTYGRLAFSSQTGRFYVLGLGGTYPSAQASSDRVMGFDFATGLWVRSPGNPQVGYGASAVDETGRIWYLGRDGGQLLHLDPGADAWTTHGAPATGYYYAGATVDPARHLLVLTQDGQSVTVYDLTKPDEAAQKVATSGLATKPGQAPGLEAVPSLDRLAMWSGGRTVHWLDPATWAWKSVEGTGDDPGAATPNGTFGRFRYSARLGVFVVVSAAAGNVSLFKPPATAP